MASIIFLGIVLRNPGQTQNPYWENGFLTPEEKEENCLISSIRIKVEHAIGGVKRLGVATNIFRGRLGSDDRFTFVSAALWNFHLQYAA